MGLRAAGGNHHTLKKYAAMHGLEIPRGDHSLRTRRAIEMHTVPDEIVFKEDSPYTKRAGIKRRLLKLGWEEACALCGQTPEWNGKPLTLQLDHINGRSNDNRTDNLRFLCPNCHAQTETYRGHNIKDPKRCACGATINARSRQCKACASKS